jgi:tetratricopeptide (TPR) repeat protein
MAFPADDIETLATRDNLAASISKQGRYAEAVTEYQALRPMQEGVLGIDHPDTLRTRMALANTLARLCLDANGRVADTDNLRKSETEYREVIALMEKKIPPLGPRHPQTLEARYGLADVLYFQKDFSAAEAEHRAVLDIRRSVLSPTHKKTFQSQAGLARALYGLGRVDEAAAELTQLIEAQERAPDRDDGDYKNNLKTLEMIRAFQEAQTR